MLKRTSAGGLRELAEKYRAFAPARRRISQPPRDPTRCGTFSVSCLPTLTYVRRVADSPVVSSALFPKASNRDSLTG